MTTTTTVTVTLAGASVDWLTYNSSWGNMPQETDDAKSARTKLLAAPSRKVGKGTTTTLDLTVDEADSLQTILDSIAGAGESMDSYERGTDAYAYKIMRRDADRIYDRIKGMP